MPTRKSSRQRARPAVDQVITRADFGIEGPGYLLEGIGAGAERRHDDIVEIDLGAERRDGRPAVVVDAQAAIELQARVAQDRRAETHLERENAGLQLRPPLRRGIEFGEPWLRQNLGGGIGEDIGCPAGRAEPRVVLGGARDPLENPVGLALPVGFVEQEGDLHLDHFLVGIPRERSAEGGDGLRLTLEIDQDVADLGMDRGRVYAGLDGSLECREGGGLALGAQFDIAQFLPGARVRRVAPDRAAEEKEGPGRRARAQLVKAHRRPAAPQARQRAEHRSGEQEERSAPADHAPGPRNRSSRLRRRRTIRIRSPISPP